MPAILALLPQIFALLPTVTTGVEHLIAWIESIRASAQQSGEWTPELDDQYRASLLATRNNPAYQPDQDSAINPATSFVIPEAV